MLHTTIRIGLSSPIRLLHITDTHLCLADARDGERKLRLAEGRTREFGTDPGPEAYLREHLAYAKKEGLPILHTGDLIDFVSLANLEAARDLFADTDCVFAAGNHEFSLYVGEAFEDIPYKMQSMGLVQAHFPTPLFCASRVIGGVNFVALDDGYYRFHKDHLTFLKQQISRGLPIVLLLHNPIHTDDLYKYMFEVRKAPCAYLTGTPAELMGGYDEYRFRQQVPDEDTLAVIRAIYEEPLIKAVLAGHLHFDYEGPLPNGIPQYVTGGEFDGCAREITIL